MSILHYERAIARDPGFLEAYNNLVGLMFFFLLYLFVHLFASSFLFNSSINLLFVVVIKGNALKDAGRAEEAVQYYRVCANYVSCANYIHMFICAVIV